MSNISYYRISADPEVLKSIEGFSRGAPDYEDERTLYMSCYDGRGPEGHLVKAFPNSDVTVQFAWDGELCDTLYTYKMKSGDLVFVDSKHTEVVLQGGAGVMAYPYP